MTLPVPPDLNFHSVRIGSRASDGAGVFQRLNLSANGLVIGVACSEGCAGLTERAIQLILGRADRIVAGSTANRRGREASAQTLWDHMRANGLSPQRFTAVDAERRGRHERTLADLPGAARLRRRPLDLRVQPGR